MTTEQKQRIQSLLTDYVAGYPSQSHAAATLDGVSEATVVQVLKNNWQLISDAMWRTIGRQVGWNEKQVELVETMNLQTLILYFDLAHEHGETFAIVGPAGSGKSHTGKWYARSMRGRHVYYLECAGYWNKKYFLQELLQAMGRDNTGMNVYEMMKDIVATLRRQEKPLIILDEVDKLSDPVLQFFITLYNELKGTCGFVWTSTDAIQKRINKGISAKRMGYNEIFSRLGRRFITLPGVSANEVRQLCLAHGIDSEEDIAMIRNDYEGDLRRIDRHYLKSEAKKKRRA